MSEMEKIESVITEAGQAPADQSSFVTVEGAGKTLMPGLIDVHTHLGGPGVVNRRDGTGVYGTGRKHCVARVFVFRRDGK